MMSMLRSVPDSKCRKCTAESVVISIQSSK